MKKILYLNTKILYTIIILLISFLLLSGCQKKDCIEVEPFCNDMLSENDLEDIGQQIIDDMKIAIPNATFNYWIEDNCVHYCYEVD